MCTKIETEPILNGQCCNLTFTADFETCSCNYSCAVVKCQFVHRNPMGFSRVFPLTHFLILWRNLVLTRTRSAYRAYYQFYTLHLGHLVLFFSVLLSPCFYFLQLNELFRKSDVQKDFKSVRVRNLAPSNSIIAFVEAHFNPGKVTPKFVLYSKRSLR